MGDDLMYGWLIRLLASSPSPNFTSLESPSQQLSESDRRIEDYKAWDKYHLAKNQSLNLYENNSIQLLDDSKTEIPFWQLQPTTSDLKEEKMYEDDIKIESEDCPISKINSLRQMHRETITKQTDNLFGYSSKWFRILKISTRYECSEAAEFKFINTRGSILNFLHMLKKGKVSNPIHYKTMRLWYHPDPITTYSIDTNLFIDLVDELMPLKWVLQIILDDVLPPLHSLFHVKAEEAKKIISDVIVEEVIKSQTSSTGHILMHEFLQILGSLVFVLPTAKHITNRDNGVGMIPAPPSKK